jgi:hypothetical protein
MDWFDSSGRLRFRIVRADPERRETEEEFFGRCAALILDDVEERGAVQTSAPGTRDEKAPACEM